MENKKLQKCKPKEPANILTTDFNAIKVRVHLNPHQIWYFRIENNNYVLKRQDVELTVEERVFEKIFEKVEEKDEV